VANDSWPLVDEPLRRTLARTFTIAAVVGVVSSLIAHRPAAAPFVALLALWPSLGGHFVEIAFLNGVRSRLPHTRLVQVPSRIVWWLAGGVALGSAVMFTSELLPVSTPSLRTWWMGAPIFVCVELVAHTGLALRGRPNFYRGDG
jgi:hypothetical protein